MVNKRGEYIGRLRIFQKTSQSKQLLTNQAQEKVKAKAKFIITCIEIIRFQSNYFEVKSKIACHTY